MSNNKINKDKLCGIVAKKTKVLKSDVRFVLDAIIDSIEECLVNGNSVNITNFGRFEVTELSGKINKVTDGSKYEYTTRVARFYQADKLKDKLR